MTDAVLLCIGAVILTASHVPLSTPTDVSDLDGLGTVALYATTATANCLTSNLSRAASRLALTVSRPALTALAFGC